MRVDRVFLFWLGPTDTRVATGVQSGGTRDIRFCAVASEVSRFLNGLSRRERGIWRFTLAPYPSADLPEWPLEIHDYRVTTDTRTECAIPRQFAGSPDAYPLWSMAVELIQPGTDPRHAVMLLRDTAGRVHARVVDEGFADLCPPSLRDDLILRSECGRTIVLDPPHTFVRFPAPTNIEGDVEELSVDEWLEYVSDLGATPGTTETTTSRRARSLQLAAAMKEHYDHRCQLCPDDALLIDIGDGRFYVELHHIRGLAEVETEPTDPDWCARQDATPYSLDNYGNVIVVCPYHHMLLHWYRQSLRLNRRRRAFVARDNSLVVPLVRDDHLV